MESFNDKQQLDELIKRYQDGTCTPEERAALEKWYTDYDDREHRLPGFTGAQQERVYENILKTLTQENELPRESRSILLKRPFIRWVAAAAVIILAGSIYFMAKKPAGTTTTPSRIATNRFQNDIDPGGNKATLTLGDGTTMILADHANGTIATEGEIKILKSHDGQLTYESGGHAGEVVYNTLSTPRAGKYQLVLPDGTVAWLNASSSIRFPTAFTGGERKVELTGEAYFEVTKNPAMPFRVSVKDMSVEVLGTHFNVMAYDNEGNVKTTLLEGAVKISKTGGNRFLKPGQQAISTTGAADVRVVNADTEEAVAWKNDLFWFHDADIKMVMRQLERWYDVDVVYDGAVNSKFNGSIPRTLSAIKVFNILEMTGGVHFRITGKTITVMP
jgi:transmembrane sensor